MDSSGIRMHYTDQLRHHDMGVLALGNTVSFPPMFIPPGMDRLEMNTFCGSGCTENMVRNHCLLGSGPDMTLVHPPPPTHILANLYFVEHL